MEHRESEAREKEAALEAEVSQAKAKAADGVISQTELQAVLDKVKKTKEKETIANKRLQKKQDKLLFVSFYILLNLVRVGVMFASVSMACYCIL